MNAKMVIADILDVCAGVILAQIQVSEVLDWIYTGLLIASIVLGIILKIRSALEDKRISSEEAKEIQEEVNKGLKAIKEASDKAKKEEEANKGEEAQEDK